MTFERKGRKRPWRQDLLRGTEENHETLDDGNGHSDRESNPEPREYETNVRHFAVTFGGLP
jgi:hypothetical protein